MSDVYLALGSNLGDSVNSIDEAIHLLNEYVHPIVRSNLYTSKAVGYTDQPDFFNTAIHGQTDLSPIDLLKFVKSVEQEVGRISRFRWGPREIDIDIILYDMLLLQSEVLTIPHPEYTLRDFVLQPLIDLNSNLSDPKTQIPLVELLQNLKDSQKSDLHLFHVD